MGMPRVTADSFQRKLLVDASIAPQCCLLGGHRKALDCRVLFGYSSEINDLRRTVVHFLQQSMISNCTVMYVVGTCTKTVTLSCFCLTCCQKSTMFVVQSFKFNTNQWIVLYSWNFSFKIYENAGGQDLDRWDGVGWANDRTVARAATVATFRDYGTTTISR